jgi:nitric oxide reductase large subunit
VHAHAALFGVYGMLGLGLTLVCLRALQADREWKEGLLGFSFWAMNGGLAAMIVLSLLPVGLLQTVASVQHGYWYARSSEFLGQGTHADVALDADTGGHAVRDRGARLRRLHLRPWFRIFT